MKALSEVRTGTLVRWFQDRGYGFIAPHSPGSEVFVHKADIIGEIAVHEDVQYQVGVFNGRTKAINVQAVQS